MMGLGVKGYMYRESRDYPVVVVVKVIVPMPKKPQHAVLSTDCFGVKIYLAGKCMRYF
jgi:hypothetical protein